MTIRRYRWPLIAGAMLLPVLYWLGLGPVTYMMFRWHHLGGVYDVYAKPSLWLCTKWDWYHDKTTRYMGYWIEMAMEDVAP